MKRVLLTGSAGGIATAFRAFASKKYDFVCFDRRPTPGVRRSVVGDLTDLEALKKAAQGCDAVLHLGGCRRDADFKTVLLPDNIEGTFNTYEAARLAGVKRFIFASTLQVDNGHPWDSFLPAGSPRKPDNLYALTKCFGEDLGLVYSLRYGMSVLCLRFGWVAVPADQEWMVRKNQRPSYSTLTVPDCNEIIRRCIEAKKVDYAVLPAFSLNARKARDLSPLKKILGFTPKDDAIDLYKRGKFFTSPRGPRKPS